MSWLWDVCCNVFNCSVVWVSLSFDCSLDVAFPSTTNPFQNPSCGIWKSSPFSFICACSDLPALLLSLPLCLSLASGWNSPRGLEELIIIIIINLIYIAQFDTNGILTALYIVITYIQMQYVHVCTYAEQSYKYTYTCLHIHTYTVTCTHTHLLTY